MAEKTSIKTDSNGYKPKKKLNIGKTNWLTVALFAFAIVLVLGATYGILLMTEHRTHSSAEKLVSEIVDRIDSKMMEVEEATRSELITVSRQIDDPKALEQLIYDFVKDNDFIYGSTIAFEPNAFPEYGYSFAPYSWVDSEGVHSRQLGEETDFYSEEWYAETKKELQDYWCEPYFDEGGAKIMMCTFSVPLTDENGQLVAILTADVGLEDLEEYITSINPTSESFILLRSRKGSVLVNAEKELATEKDNVIIKGMTDIGWTVELSMPFAYLMSGDTGIAFTIGVILFATVLLVYFINLLITKAQQRASEKYQHVIEEQSAFTEFFLEPYISAYYVGLDDLSIQIYKRTSNLDKEYPILTNYVDSLEQYIDREVHSDDKNDFRILIQPEKMRSMLEKHPEFSFTFRTITDGIRYVKIQVIRGADENHAAFGFVDITEEVSEQRNRQLEEEESRKLIDSIVSSYNIAYAVNMKTDSFRQLRMDDSVIDYSKQFSTFREAKEFFIHMLPECDQEKMRHELDYDTIREKLKETKSFSTEYRVPINGAMIWHEMNVTAIDIASDYVAVGFAQRDLEITQKHLEDKRYSEYFALYEIDIDSGMMKIVKDSPYYGLDHSGTAMPFAPAIIQFAAGLDDEPREFFEKFAELDYIKERFAKEDKLTYAYRSNNVNQKDWVDCTCYVTLRHEDGTPAMFTFGFSLIDSLGVYRQELQQKYVEQNAILVSQQEQLEEARNTAETANAAKTDFLFNMSHDIRTPMNAIMGFTNMAIKHIDEKEKAIDCLEKTQKAGNMLLSLINSVLEVSRIESGHAILEEQPGDVLLSFVNIENTMQEMAQTKDIKLSFEFGDVQDRFVYADFSRCMRIFVNVISNAIKYTPDGGFVKVRCEQVGKAKDGVGMYQYTVTDNGIGMSKEFQQHIFEQFSREKTSTVSGIQGSGLGMSVVKSFVDLMHGSITVKSKSGEGSEIRILLPFKLQKEETYTDPITGDIVASTSKAEQAEGISFEGKPCAFGRRQRTEPRDRDRNTRRIGIGC